jgi:class 3 adenylate cyclase
LRAAVNSSSGSAKRSSGSIARTYATLSLARRCHHRAVDVEIRYARRDRAHLAYTVSGDDPALLVMPGTFISVDAVDDHPLLARFIGRLRGLGTLLMTDRRGVGHSDPLPYDDYSPDDVAADLIAVLDAAGADRVSIVAGFDMGHGAIALAASHPERVERLVLANTFADGPSVSKAFVELREFQTAVDEGFDGTDLDVVAAVAPSVAHDLRFRTWFDAAGRRGASPATALALTTSVFSTDITDRLSSIAVPVLVLNRVDNRIVPVGAGRAMADAIPGAEFRELPGGDHLLFSGDVDPLLDAIESFVAGAVGGSGHRSLATVLFTDLVSSTESAARLGDKRWRELLDVHDSTALRIVRRHGGEVVKSTGDGLLALFDTPGSAIRAARDLQADLAPLGLAVRAGIHTGEVERRGNDVGGIAVHVAARVQSLAGAGEIVVSAVIPALTSGSGFTFDDLGDHQLKGVPGDWRLYRAD